MAKVTKEAIQNFLSGHKIAVIGASRNKRKYSGMLFLELIKHGYEVIPVNPNAESVAGRNVCRNVKDIKPAPERAVILLPEEKTEQAVLDCAEAGIRDIWLHRHVGGGVSDSRAIFRAEERGLNLITGFCMFMFLPNAAVPHKIHGFVQKIVGTYPK